MNLLKLRSLNLMVLMEMQCSVRTATSADGNIESGKIIQHREK